MQRDHVFIMCSRGMNDASYEIHVILLYGGFVIAISFNCVDIIGARGEK